MMIASIGFSRPFERFSISAKALTISFLRLQQTHLKTLPWAHMSYSFDTDRPPRTSRSYPFSKDTKSSFSSMLSTTADEGRSNQSAIETHQRCISSPSSRSILTSPNSFSITAILLAPRSLSKWFNKVVCVARTQIFQSTHPFGSRLSRNAYLSGTKEPGDYL